MTESNLAAPSAEGIGDATYPLYPDLRGKTVFVTGGGSGIGAYLVHAFAMQGANVGFVSMPDDPGAALCEAIVEVSGARPMFVPCDLRDIAALRAAIAEVVAAFGPIGVLVNNAARDDRHTLDSLDVAGWDDALDVNLRPHFFTAQAVAAGMRAAGGGAIVNLGSNSALLGLTGYPAYVTAKAAILGLTRALARELGGDGIRANALIPGWVLTRRQRALWATPEAVAGCLEQQCLKRSVRAEDIAHSALFLASNTAAASITGQALVVDGGRVLR